MMRITVEIVPDGDERAAEVVHVIEIVNRSPAASAAALYSYDTPSGRSGTVTHIREEGALILAAKVLCDLHDRRGS